MVQVHAAKILPIAAGGGIGPGTGPRPGATAAESESDQAHSAPSGRQAAGPAELSRILPSIPVDSLDGRADSLTTKSVVMIPDTVPASGLADGGRVWHRFNELTRTGW